MTAQPKDLMTLEETTGKLKAWQLELTRASKGEAMWGSLYFKALSEDLGQALHHLEVGRKERDWLFNQYAEQEALLLTANEENRKKDFGELMASVKEQLSAHLSTLSASTAQEVKG